jgi:hypothetical protein
MMMMMMMMMLLMMMMMMARYFQSIAQQRGGPRTNRVKNSDRIFSRSSVTAPKVTSSTTLRCIPESEAACRETS